MTGDMVAKAEVVTENDRPAISFTLTPLGQTRFAEITRANIGRRIALLVDGQVVTAPTVTSEITGGSGLITGKFSQSAAVALAQSMTLAGKAAARR